MIGRRSRRRRSVARLPVASERESLAASLSAADVTAILVAYNDPSRLRTCVASVASAGVGRVVVWDNSEDSAARAQIAALATDAVRVKGNGSNLGFGAGVNRAVEGVHSVLILLINPDCEIDADCLEAMVGRFSGSSDLGVVAPRMRYRDGSFGFAGGGTPTVLKEILAATKLDDLVPRRVRSRVLKVGYRLRDPLRRQASMQATSEEGGPVEIAWVSGFCMMMPTAVFRALGGFDEEYFLYFEDVDLCERVTAAGYRVVVDRTVSALHEESTATAAAGKSSHYWRGLATYLEKHDRNWSAVVFQWLAGRARL